MTMILAGAAGGAVWAGITLAATWWFNRRVRQRSGLPLAQVEGLKSRVLRDRQAVEIAEAHQQISGAHVYVRRHGNVYVPSKRGC